MRISKRPKGNGKFRTIYMPNAKEKRKLRDLLPLLNEIHAKAVDAAGTRGIAHAFVANRNPVTCALPHRGFQVTVSCDLENWFDTVREDQLVAAGVPPDVAKAITIPDENGVGLCRQGLPTSPLAANIAAVAMDVQILEHLKQLQNVWVRFRFAYTRYADDIIVSVSLDTDEVGGPLPDEWREDSLFWLKSMILHSACKMDWKIAEHKTHIQHAKAGRRIIVGIAVDDRLQATRKTRRKLRAARHQAHPPQVCAGRANGVARNPAAVQSAAGLAEWAACKLPRKVRSTRQMMGVLAGSGPVAASTNQTPTVAISGSGRRVLVPVRKEGSDAS